MNLFCPHCQKLLTVPEQFAGQQMKCPMCAGLFQAPGLPGAAGSPPSSAAASGMSVAPPSYPTPPQAPPSPAEAAKPSEGETIVPGSHEAPSAYGVLDDQLATLSPVKPPAAEPEPPPTILASSFSPSPSLDRPEPRPRLAPLPHEPGRVGVRISPAVVPWVTPAALLLVFIFSFFPWLTVATETTSWSAWTLAFASPTSPLLIMFDLLLVPTLLFSIASLAVTLDRLPTDRLPPAARPVVNLRVWIVVVLAALGLVFIGLQLVLHFGVELAEFKDGTNVRFYLMTRTLWLFAAALLQAVAVAGAFLEGFLHRHGNHPIRVSVGWEPAE